MAVARHLPVAVVLAAGLAVTHDLEAQSRESATYWVYVANESSDLVSLVRFDGRTAVEERVIEVGYHPVDLDGAQGLTVSPDGAFWYVSFAHGQPYGRVWKMRTGTDELVDSATVGLFPATMALSPDGSTLFAANFNLHGDPVASSVSTVFTPFMAPTGQIETCVRPHGSRVSHDGLNHYSGCLLSDQLVEISTRTLMVTRRLRLSAGREGPVNVPPGTVVSADGACRPTWVVVSPDDRELYVTCNGRAEILAIDRETFEITRRSATGLGPYSAAASPDGSRLVVTLKGEQAVAIFDLETGAERRVATSRSLTHGVVISPDGRYAFVSNEAVGATRGTVDVIDIASAEPVAIVEVQYQLGGIGFWKMEPAR